MDRQEALAILDAALARYRDRSYSDLARMIETQDTSEVQGSSGVTYQLEIEFIWDGFAHGNLRVMGSIDDGGWRAYLPLTRSFIITPAGDFVGE